MGKKSAAQIRRLELRALKRGETYAAPKSDGKNFKMGICKQLIKKLDHIANDSSLSEKERRAETRKAEAIAMEEIGCTKDELKDLLNTVFDEEVKKVQKKMVRKEKDGKNVKMRICKQLKKKLDHIANDSSLNAKERRAETRKAEAIAMEEVGCTKDELKDLLDTVPDEGVKKDKKKMVTKEKDVTEKSKAKPYILFVGQLSYSTTKDDIFEHFQQQLGIELINEQTFGVRLLTAKDGDGVSRGMAFIEMKSAELVFECLKLHHSFLDGRRINVERSAGGRKSNPARVEKIKELRKKQDEAIADHVKSLHNDYKADGRIKEGEFDDNVLTLCKRHSIASIDAAFAQYVEAKKDKVLDNSSAYFTEIITRITEEGEESMPRFKKRKRNTE